MDWNPSPEDEENLKEALWNCFTLLYGNQLRDEEEGLDGKYITAYFDSLRNPQGEGDFRISFHQPDGETTWKIVDYAARKQGEVVE